MEDTLRWRLKLVDEAPYLDPETRKRRRLEVRGRWEAEQFVAALIAEAEAELEMRAEVMRRHRALAERRVRERRERLVEGGTVEYANPYE